MKLKILDQIAISSVSPDTLKPGTEINVSKTFGDDLLKLHPDKFVNLDADEKSEKAEAASPENKAETAAPANKAELKGKAKTK